MKEKNDWGNIASRQESRYSQISDLTLAYEGVTEAIELRPPDLSTHGMFINTAQEFPEGAILKLKFRISRTGAVVETRCEVRYCLQGVGIGVEFIGISPAAARAIEDGMGLSLADK
jgi:hypothetical protein